MTGWEYVSNLWQRACVPLCRTKFPFLRITSECPPEWKWSFRHETLQGCSIKRFVCITSTWELHSSKSMSYSLKKRSLVLSATRWQSLLAAGWMNVLCPRMWRASQVDSLVANYITAGSWRPRLKHLFWKGEIDRSGFCMPACSRLPFLFTGETSTNLIPIRRDDASVSNEDFEHQSWSKQNGASQALRNADVPRRYGWCACEAIHIHVSTITISPPGAHKCTMYPQ